MDKIHVILYLPNVPTVPVIIVTLNLVVGRLSHGKALISGKFLLGLVISNGIVLILHQIAKQRGIENGIKKDFLLITFALLGFIIYRLQIQELPLNSWLIFATILFLVAALQYLLIFSCKLLYFKLSNRRSIHGRNALPD
jgi:hypothetical protein